MHIIIKVDTLNLIISLGQNPLTLYMYFVGMSISKGECFPSYDRIQADTGLNRHAIKAALDLLKSHKLLEIQKRFHQSAIYRPLQYAWSRSNRETLSRNESAEMAFSLENESAPDTLPPNENAPDTLPINNESAPGALSFGKASQSAPVTLELKDLKDSRKEEEVVERGGESERGRSASTKNPKKPKTIPKFLPESPKEALEHPILQRFKAVTDRIPGCSDYGIVIDTMEVLITRWGEQTEDELKKYWLSWINRTSRNGTGYRQDNLTWLLEWAINEHIPPVTAGAGAQRESKPKSFDGLKKYLDREAQSGST